MNNTKIYTMEDMRIEEWHGKGVRFLEIDGEWYAVLKDICDIFGLKTFDVSRRLDPDFLEKVRIRCPRFRPAAYKNYDMGLNGVVKSESTQTMVVINEFGIYETMYASKKLEARKFRKWVGETLRILRKKVGLEGYQVLQLTEPEVQDEITWFLENISWDEATQQMVYTKLKPGHNEIEVIPLDEWAKEN